MGRRRFVGEAAVSKAYATFDGCRTPPAHQGRAQRRTKMEAGSPARRLACTRARALVT